jgi:hypothetical protein
MKIKKVQSTKKGEKEYYYKYVITPVPKEIVEQSGLLDKNLKAKVEKGKILLEKE